MKKKDDNFEASISYLHFAFVFKHVFIRHFKILASKLVKGLRDKLDTDPLENFLSLIKSLKD